MGRERKKSAKKKLIPDEFRPISVQEGPGVVYAAVHRDPAQGQVYYLAVHDNAMGPLNQAQLQALQLAIRDVLDGSAVTPLG